jgi:SAM-dependent methyltransferase
MSGNEIRNMDEMEKINCPICDIDRTRPFLPRFSGRIVRCESCGLVYVNPRQTSEKTSVFFKKEYISDNERLENKFSNVRAPALALEAAFIKNFKTHGRILDVGCAGGDFLEHFMTDPSWECMGIEPSRVAAEAAREKGILTFAGLLEDFRLQENSYDIITIIDTLFFIAWPFKQMVRIHHALKDDGIMAVEIPGFAFRMMRNIGPISLLVNRRWIHLDENSPHLFYYSANTIRRLLERAGFKIVAKLPIPSPDYGSRGFRFLMKLYHFLAVLLYKITFGQINLAAKTVYICRKTETS